MENPAVLQRDFHAHTKHLLTIKIYRAKMCSILQLGGEVMRDCGLHADDLGYLIKQISDKMRANADAVFRKHGLTYSQVHVLSFVQACGGSATQKEIEIYLDVSHPTIVGLVSRLEKSGFVTSYVDENNRRNKIVCVTKKAQQTRESLEIERQKTERRLEQALGQQEREQLMHLLSRLSQIL